MFTATLLTFQSKHEENLLRKCADHEEIVTSKRLLAPVRTHRSWKNSNGIKIY
jgi:hypothetical protein